MKNTLTRMLLLAAALVLAMSLCLAHAEETTEETAEVSTTAYIFWQDADWWPAVVEAENEYWTPITAQVTGEGYYTVGVQAHMPSWFYSGGNTNKGAQKMAIVIKDGATLFPDLYMQITDIRVDGVSYPCEAVTYGQTGYDNADGDLKFWAANDTYGLIYDQWMIDNGGTIQTGNTWSSTATAQNFNIFDVNVLDNPSTIEIDFFLSAQQDVKPAGAPALRVIGQGPRDSVEIVELTDLTEPPENATTARIFWESDGWIGTSQTTVVESTKETVIGEGEYSATINFLSQGWGTFAGQGNNATKLGLVIEDAFGENSIMDGMYVGISDLRVNGESVTLDNPGFGQPSWTNQWEAWDENDGVVFLYHQGADNPWSYKDAINSNWKGETGNYRPMDGTTLGAINSIEIDFFVTDTKGALPEPPVLEYEYKWYPDNTMSLAGISLRDKGITDKWYNVVPVDLATNGIYEIPMIASNMYQIGTASVAVEDGQATVTYTTTHASAGNLVVGSECVKWFGGIEEITDEFCDAPTSEIAFGEAVDVSALGDVGYLFICNRVTYSQPVTSTGVYLPRYWANEKQWVDYRAALEALMAPAAEEVPAE